jgi:hypothetical protein
MYNALFESYIRQKYSKKYMLNFSPHLLKQGAAACLNLGPPCLNIGTLLIKPSTLPEKFLRTQ